MPKNEKLLYNNVNLNFTNLRATFDNKPIARVIPFVKWTEEESSGYYTYSSNDFLMTWRDFRFTPDYEDNLLYTDGVAVSRDESTFQPIEYKASDYTEGVLRLRPAIPYACAQNCAANYGFIKDIKLCVLKEYTSDIVINGKANEKDPEYNVNTDYYDNGELEIKCTFNTQLSDRPLSYSSVLFADATVIRHCIICLILDTETMIW